LLRVVLVKYSGQAGCIVASDNRLLGVGC